jgi:hypothetical protein
MEDFPKDFARRLRDHAAFPLFAAFRATAGGNTGSPKSPKSGHRKVLPS